MCYLSRKVAKQSLSGGGKRGAECSMERQARVTASRSAACCRRSAAAPPARSGSTSHSAAPGPAAAATAAHSVSWTYSTG